MPAPLGFGHRHERGLRGMFARWWYRRRVKAIHRAIGRD